MIERIRIRNYRSLHDVDVRLEPLTVLIGRSGSGKSNFVRAVRLLRDVLAGRAELQNGPWSNRPFGMAKAELAYEVELRVKGFDRLTYFLSFNEQPYPAVREERLDAGGRTVFHQSGARWLTAPAVIPHPGPGGLCLGTLTGDRRANASSTSDVVGF